MHLNVIKGKPISSYPVWPLFSLSFLKGAQKLITNEFVIEVSNTMQHLKPFLFCAQDFLLLVDLNFCAYKWSFNCWLLIGFSGSRVFLLSISSSDLNIFYGMSTEFWNSMQFLQLDSRLALNVRFLYRRNHASCLFVHLMQTLFEVILWFLEASP